MKPQKCLLSLFIEYLIMLLPLFVTYRFHIAQQNIAQSVSNQMTFWSHMTPIPNYMALVEIHFKV